MMRWILTLLLAGGIYTAMRSLDQPPVNTGVQGSAYVHDGDTFTVASVKIRLFGVDAPEMDQTCEMPDGTDWACGRWSRDQVRDMLRGRTLRCVKQTYDRYGRMVARCYLGDQDLAQLLVRGGIVFSYARYSRDYIGVEKAAIAAGRGLWVAKVVAPAEFRRSKREN
ncbi:MAG: nuclease [Marinosulfonomonas sp.]|nr:MAG: nuclease [Marinosulfonomonas sp.]